MLEDLTMVDGKEAEGARINKKALGSIWSLVVDL
jgi:hypothetical protein